jgi:hypothetical protein
MVPARSLPTLAFTLAVLGVVAWMNISAGPETSLYDQPAVQAHGAQAG